MPKRPPLSDDEAHAIGEAYAGFYESSRTPRLRWVNCQVCGGSGEIIRRDPVGPYDDPGAAEYAEICAACEGTGRDVETG